jgi:hypothetical protein
MVKSKVSGRERRWEEEKDGRGKNPAHIFF